MQAPVAVIFERFGPYHVARLRAAAKRAPLIAIEVVAKDSTYAWEVVGGVDGFRRVTLFETQEDNIGCSAVEHAVRTVLERERPAALALPGWSAPEALASLAWALSNSVPAVLMAESQRHDHRRTRLRESIKHRIVSLYSAALVGGSRQVEYAADLGLARECIFTTYNVVDNEHFSAGAEQVCEDVTLRARLGLPAHFFLTCCRFVEKKNLPRLLEAYGHYRLFSSDPWGLVLVGDGPLWKKVRTIVQRLDLEKSVLTPGFKQYEELPAYYALSSAAVLPSVSEPWGLVINEAMATGLPVLVSNRCGCAPDLVENGLNGFTFDPYDAQGLAQLMLKVSSMSEEQRRAMGGASREIISHWTPETFAENLEKAIHVALAAPRPEPSVLDRALIWALTHRP